MYDLKGKAVWVAGHKHGGQRCCRPAVEALALGS